MSFVSTLKRRKIFQVAAVYLVVAWAIMSVVDMVNEPLRLPEWFDTVVILFLAIGFPVAVVLILGWAFDLTPALAVRDRGTTVLASSSRQRRSGYVLIGLLVLAVGRVTYRVEINPSEQAVGTIAGESQRELLPNSVAVLPFKNLSPSAEDAYFAAGMHDEILKQLAKLLNLNVISRTSAVRYVDSDLSIPEIADELEVEAIMEGTVRYAEGRVRITIQLIDGETNAHLWSGTYENEFEVENIFAIELDIAARIAKALEGQYLPSERASTENSRPVGLVFP
jgi:TolB-like protein